MPPQRDLNALLDDDLEEIEAAANAYHRGRLSAYQTIAIQLRNLLVDRNPRSGSLLLRLLPDATFERLAPSSVPPEAVRAAKEGRGWISPRGWIRMTTGASAHISLQLEVLENDLIPIDEWLDDWIVTGQVRIGDLIYEVASKDVAHTDDESGPAMQAIEGGFRVTAGGREIEMRRIAIVAIGEYVAQRIRELLTSDAPR